MSKEELLKYLIAEIDLIMHDKDYRFENANGTWYSRESCRDLTNEEVFEELRTELRQFTDLEAKLAESERKNFELLTKLNLKEYAPAFCTLADRDCEALGQIEKLKQQLAEKDKAIENWQTMYESVVQTCHNDKEEIERLNKQLETQENTITNLVEDNRASQEWYKKQLEEKEKENELMAKTLKLTKFVEKEVNQDKISFTIQQLEKVKEEIDKRPLTVRNCGYGEFEEILLDDVYDVIDNQIKQLKEMK